MYGMNLGTNKLCSDVNKFWETLGLAVLLGKDDSWNYSFVIQCRSIDNFRACRLEIPLLLALYIKGCMHLSGK